VRIGVSRKPILAIDLFAIGFKDRILVVLIFRNAFAPGFDNLQILSVNPDSSLKESLLDLLDIGHDLRTNVKDEKIQFVDLLFPDILETIRAEFVGFESEGIDASQIFEILRRDTDV